MYGIASTKTSNGLLKFEKEISLYKPILSSLALSNTLSDPEAAPLFTRLSLTSGEYAMLLVRVIQTFKWKKVLTVS
ncbi:MAG: hypothetical protein V2I33_19490 [Kangiellaceae bacterium]|jgi:hypothetical protein|nr:hypothetical protein [Kangiellaceae bacterium]